MLLTTEELGEIGTVQWTAAVFVGHNGMAMWLLRIVSMPQKNPRPCRAWECQPAHINGLYRFFMKMRRC
jgi:hypothetical protein